MITIIITLLLAGILSVAILLANLFGVSVLNQQTKNQAKSLLQNHTLWVIVGTIAIVATLYVWSDWIGAQFEDPFRKIALLVVVVVLILGAWQTWQNPASGARTAFVTTVKIMFVLGVAWFFWPNIFDDTLNQRAFDPNTGEPVVMGYYDLAGNWKDDEDGRKPAECRTKKEEEVEVVEDGQTVKKTQMVPVPHDGFNYSQAGTCFSRTTGERLIAKEAKNVPILPDLNPLDSAEELEREKGIVRGSCTPDSNRIHLYYLLEIGDSEVICLKPKNRIGYRAYFSQGMANRACLRFSGSTPTRNKHEPQPKKEDVGKFYEMTNGSSQDVKVIKTANWSLFAPDKPLAFDVYICR